MTWLFSPLSRVRPPTVSPQPPQSPLGVRWRRLCTQGSLWLAAEIVMGLIGLDTIADYSEFLLQSRLLHGTSITITQNISVAHSI